MPERHGAHNRPGVSKGRPRPSAAPGAGPEVLVGRNSVREALRAGRRRIHRVLVAEGAQGENVDDILGLCASAGVPVARVSRVELDRLGTELAHQGVAAQTSTYPYVGLDDILACAEERGEAPFLLALDLLQDPQNVGSLLRTAEAVGVHGAIVPARRAAGVTPAVSRASAGAVEHLLVAQVTNLVRVLETLKDRGLWVVGVEDVPLAQDYHQADLNMPLVVVVGSEGQGMRRLVMDTCDLLVRIPMRGRVGSLNASVAASIVLYQAWMARCI